MEIAAGTFDGIQNMMTNGGGGPATAPSSSDTDKGNGNNQTPHTADQDWSIILL